MLLILLNTAAAAACCCCWHCCYQVRDALLRSVCWRHYRPTFNDTVLARCYNTNEELVLLEKWNQNCLSGIMNKFIFVNTRRQAQDEI